MPGDDVTRAYASLLMGAMRLTATRLKHANILGHIANYFKKRLTPDEREELRVLIDKYRAGLAPLDAPVVLLNHYVRKYDDSFLKRQYYLKLHQLAQMARNHA